MNAKQPQAKEKGAMPNDVEHSIEEVTLPEELQEVKDGKLIILFNQDTPDHEGLRLSASVWNGELYDWRFTDEQGQELETIIVRAPTGSPDGGQVCYRYSDGTWMYVRFRRLLRGADGGTPIKVPEPYTPKLPDPFPPKLPDAGTKSGSGGDGGTKVIHEFLSM